MDPLYLLFGVKSVDAAAGALGGSLYAAMTAKAFRDWAVSIGAGAFAGGFIAPGAYDAMIHYAVVPNENRIEFAVISAFGLAGTVVCKGIVRFARRWAENPKNLQGPKP